MIIRVLIIPVTLLILTSCESLAHPFSAGERLVYDLSWYGVSGGTTVFEVNSDVDKDRPVYRIRSTVKSNRFISMFYPVNDIVESYIDIKTLYPYRYRSRQQEGSYSSDKEIIFDRTKNMATYINNKKGGERRISQIVAGAHDPLSVVYFFRTRPLRIGEPVYIDVHDGKRNWTLVVQVLKREKVWTPAGAFNTIKVKALIRYEGLFVQKGDLVVWFTDDEARIPVKMESKIGIGHFTALLIEKQ